MLRLHIESQNDLSQINCEGRIVHGDGSDLLRRSVLARQEDTVALELSGIQSVDAAGLGTLVYLRDQLALEGRELILLSPPSHLLELFHLTGLDGAFAVAESCVA